MSSPDPLRDPPRWPLPAGATDCHAHVFGPYERFALAADRSYTPPAAPLETYLAMSSRMGLSRGVLVHPSAYGSDWSALLDALRRERRRLRGIVVIDTDVSDSMLGDMQACGVRGARFVEAASAPGRKFAGSVGLDRFDLLAPRLRALGWHAEIWAGCDRLAEEGPRLLRAGVPLVFDHMGGIDVERGLDDRSFIGLLRLLGTGQVWIKLSAPRASRRFPDYEDVRPFQEAYLQRNADRLIWGSDWPFIRMNERTPAVGHLVDLFHLWTDDAAVRRAVLVENPAALYGFT